MAHKRYSDEQIILRGILEDNNEVIRKQLKQNKEKIQTAEELLLEL